MKKQFIIEVDESEIVECWNEQAAKELGYQEYALSQCPGIKVKPYDPSGDCISREALRKLVVDVRSWHTPICSGGTEYGEGAIEMADEIIELIDKAPAVKFSLLPADESKEEAYMRGYEHGKIEGIIKGMAIAEKSQGKCKTCRHRDPEDKKCDCGGLERQGCPFPVSDDYFCEFYEKGGTE